MKISTKGRYALRLMVDLAVHYNGDYIKIRQIAERQELSNKYLEQIIPQLVKAGLVQSTRGSQGGYRLAKPPEQYTVGTILRLMEGNLAPVACLETAENTCPRRAQCVTLGVWQQLKTAIDQVVDGITLADLAEQQKALGGDDYVI